VPVDANLSSRVLTAALGVPLLVLFVGWSPSWLFAAVFFVLTVGALHEYFTIVFPNRGADRRLGTGFGICLSGTIFLNKHVDPLLWLDLVVLIGFCIYTFSGGALPDRLKRLAISLLGAVYAGYFLPHWVLLFRLPGGRAWVFWVLIVIMVGDTMAYFTGRRFGARKLAPEISPGKTVAGAWGYVFGAVMAGWFGAAILFDSINWLEISILSVVLSVLGQLGDLFESWIKRVFAVKDSGHLLPGHGGLLDRLDSLIFPAVFTTAYLQAFHR
jgi:phosphatidate cytidylyltransferase